MAAAAYDGSTLVAKYLGENVNLLIHTPLEQLLQRRELDWTSLMKNVLKKIAIVHARGMIVGAELVSFNHIFIADSTEGPKAILTIPKESSYGTVQDDIRATGRLFHTIWAKRSQALDLLQSDLISRISEEEITAAEAFHHFALWSSSKRLSFLKKVSDIFINVDKVLSKKFKPSKKVSDILELKQKNHLGAIEAESRWVY